MKCTECGHIFQYGEVKYENSGISPLCYSCAERGSMVAVFVLLSIFAIVIAIALISQRFSDDYKIEQANKRNCMNNEFTFLTPKQLKEVKRVKRMCMDKNKYDSEWDAENYGKLYNYRNNANRPYRPYFCSRCLKWHLSTQPKYSE